MSINIFDLMRGGDGDSAHNWFTEIWRQREERYYTRLFGMLPNTVLPVPQQALMAILPAGTILKPEWSRHAVIEFEPGEKHRDWLYVTTGLSQPWEIEKEADLQPEGQSGLGFEMVLRSPERASWAVDVLHRLMVYQIGVGAKLIRGKLFGYGDWMVLNGPISPQVPDTKLRAILMSHPRDFEPRFGLPSGRVELLQLVGIAGGELAYLLATGPDRLEADLYNAKAAPTTDPRRAPIEVSRYFDLPPQLAPKF